MSASSAPARPTGISPAAIVVCGCLVSLITFGPRASSGLFQIPMTVEYGWTREVFSLALAVQNLLWGVGQPFSGALADRYGTVRVFVVGLTLYALGLVVMAYASTPGMLQLGAGVLIGFGLSACSFNLVLAAFAKLLPDEWKPIALGAGTAAGSFGQFFYPPIGNILIETIGWHQALVVFAASVLAALPLTLALATRGTGAKPKGAPVAGPSIANQTIAQALAEAFRHRSYVLLVIGFFTCGFQLAFITVHMPA
jgi:MFS family permease